MINYLKGRSYSWALNRFLYQDILHDAYVNYHHKTGKNLFDEPIKTVIRTIKLTYWGYYINRRFVANRVGIFSEFDDNTFLTVTPEFIEGEELEQLIQQIKKNYPRTSEAMIQSLNLKLEGYQQQEIAEKMGVPKSLITYYFKNIRMHVNNPFAGNPCKISKKVSRRTYDEKYATEYKYDPDRDCDLNESYTITVNKDGEYLLVKEK